MSPEGDAPTWLVRLFREMEEDRAQALASIAEMKAELVAQTQAVEQVSNRLGGLDRGLKEVRDKVDTQNGRVGLLERQHERHQQWLEKLQEWVDGAEERARIAAAVAQTVLISRGQWRTAVALAGAITVIAGAVVGVQTIVGTMR